MVRQIQSLGASMYEDEAAAAAAEGEDSQDEGNGPAGDEDVVEGEVVE